MQCAEIGSFEGRGSLFLHKHLCSVPGSKLYCIDHWQDNYGSVADPLKVFDKTFVGQYERFQKNTSAIASIVPMRGLSNDMIPMLPDGLDFVYIDGDHCPNQTYKDATQVLPKMKPGGIILFDDYGFVVKNVRTKEGIDRFVKDHASKVKVLLQNYQLGVRVL